MSGRSVWAFKMASRRGFTEVHMSLNYCPLIGLNSYELLMNFTRIVRIRLRYDYVRFYCFTTKPHFHGVVPRKFPKQCESKEFHVEK